MEEIDRFRRHHHLERGEPLAVLAQEVEEIPLRHERDEGIFDVETAEIRDPHLFSAEHSLHPLQALMRQPQKAFDQPEFVHYLQRRGMHGVAAKIAKEVRMLLQHHDIDAGAAEQIAQHHAGRPAADDAAAYLHGVAGARCEDMLNSIVRLLL